MCNSLDWVKRYLSTAFRLILEMMFLFPSMETSQVTRSAKSRWLQNAS